MKEQQPARKINSPGPGGVPVYFIFLPNHAFKELRNGLKHEQSLITVD